ncbi:hypothetical protein [Microbacterium gubbeenense]|uniref:hypothetical protein n=1 Tax=Microbacterium gubbeenense TaxID=159896 RepID=UPI003F9A50B7
MLYAATAVLAGAAVVLLLLSMRPVTDRAAPSVDEFEEVLLRPDVNAELENRWTREELFDLRANLLAHRNRKALRAAGLFLFMVTVTVLVIAAFSFGMPIQALCLVLGAVSLAVLDWPNMVAASKAHSFAAYIY